MSYYKIGMGFVLFGLVYDIGALILYPAHIELALVGYVSAMWGVFVATRQK